MAVAQPHHHRRARRRGFVAAVEMLAGLDQREGARGVDAERLEHLGRENLAHAALEREAAVAGPAPRRRPRSLGAEVHQPALRVAHLREQEAAAVAEIGIVVAELVAVIAQRQRLRQRALERLEAPEAGDPFGVGQPVEPDLGRRAIVAEAQDGRRENRRRRPDREGVAEGEDARLRGEVHAAIWGAPAPGDKHDRSTTRSCTALRRWLVDRDRRSQAPLSRLSGRRAGPAADPVHPGADPQRARFRARWRSGCRRRGG